MLKKYILLLVFLPILIHSENKTFIKIGISDCSSCNLYIGDLLKYNPTFVLNEKYNGFESEIFNEYIGINKNEIKYIFSDSLYFEISNDNFSWFLGKNKNQKIIEFRINEYNKFYKYLDEYSKLYFKPDTIKTKYKFHNNCILKKSEFGIANLDLLFSKFTYFEFDGKIKYEFKRFEGLAQEIYEIQKPKISYEKYDDFVKRNNVLSKPVSFLNFSFDKNGNIYLLVSCKTLDLLGEDTAISSIYSIIKLDNFGKYQILYFDFKPNLMFSVGASKMFYNDSIFKFPVYIYDKKLPKHIIVEYTLKNNKIMFSKFSNDTLPQPFIKSKMNYNYSTFSIDKQFVAFYILGEIYKDNIKLPKLNLFEEYSFDNNLNQSMNGILDILVNGNNILISYCNKNKTYIVKYNLKTELLSKPIFEIENSDLIVFPIFGNNSFLLIDKDHQIIINKI